MPRRTQLAFIPTELALMSMLVGCGTTARGTDSRPASVPTEAARATAVSPASGPDRFAAARPVGPGTQPRLAIDGQRRRLHLVYVHEGKLLYRTGQLDGAFDASEIVFAADGLWDPNLVLDDGGVPHIVVADGHYKNRYTWYTNRLGGAWKERLIVVDKHADRTDRTTTPHLFVREGVAYVGTFTVGGEGLGERWGMLARLGDLDGSPRIATKRPIDPWNPQVFLVGDELWIGGRNKANHAKGRRHFTFQRHDAATLAEQGDPITASGDIHGEMGRASLDERGDIHAAGTLNREPRKTAGWYNTLARARAGLPPVKYHTTNVNASGAALPLRDRAAADRVYVFYWSGSTEGEPKTCAPGNQIRFTRIEKGEKAVEERPVTDRSGIHGISYRQTPCAAPHPDGGMLVVFEECGAEPVLHVTRVGG